MILALILIETIPDDDSVDPFYFMDYEDEAVTHDPELDAEGEDEEEWW